MAKNSDFSLVMNARGQHFHLGCPYDYRTDKILHHKLKLPWMFEVKKTNNAGETNEQRIINLTPIGNIQLLDRQDREEKKMQKPQYIASFNFPDKEALWDFFQESPPPNELDLNGISRSNWEVNHFNWHGKNMLDSELACLDHHSKVSLLTNMDATDVYSTNALWSHDFDRVNEVAGVLSVKYVASKLTLDITDDTLLEEGSWSDEAEGATHLVTAVQYGIEIKCILQRYVRKGEAVQDAEIEMRSLCSTLVATLKSGKPLEIGTCNDVTATVYGMDKKPVHGTCREMFAVLETTINSFEQVKHLCRPLRVWLMPLKKYFETSFTGEINKQDFVFCEDYIDRINVLKAQANTLLQVNDGVKHFMYPRPLLHTYKALLEKEKVKFQSNLRRRVIELRSLLGNTEHLAITEELTEAGNVFIEAAKTWLEDMKNEVSLLNTIEGHTRQLHIPLILDEDEIYRYLTDVKIKQIRIFTLPPLTSQKNFLDEISLALESSSDCSVLRRFPVYRCEEQELWHKTKRIEFYRKARHFFKDVLNCQKLQQQAEDGARIAFLMTPVSFESDMPKTPNILVYEDGNLVNEGCWSEKLSSLLPSIHANLELASKRGSSSHFMKVPKKNEDEMRSSSDLLGALSDASTGSDVYEKGTFTGGAYHASNSMGSFNNGNDYQPDVESNYTQLSAECASTDYANGFLTISEHEGQALQEGGRKLTKTGPPYNSSQSFDMSELNRNESVDLEILQNHTQAGLNDSQLSIISASASQDSLSTFGSGQEHLTDDIKETVRGKSQLKANISGIDVYALPMTTSNPSKKGKAHHLAFNQLSEFGESFSMHRRTILLMGATASGKTSLINSIVNHVMGVKWNDRYRFEIETKASSTNAITVYEINHAQRLQIPYSLTIIDTPGYGGAKSDTDKNITESLRQYFKDENSIQEVDAVCFVCSTSGSNSVTMQKYVADSMLSVFGKDVKDNIYIFFTFTDSKPSTVADFIHKTKPTFCIGEQNQPSHYLISNLAYKAANDDLYDFWCSSTESLKEFFNCISLVQPKSLMLTKRVLTERRRLERTLEALRSKISENLQKMDEFQKYRNVLSETSPDKQESYKITVAVRKKENISNTGKYLTNCQICQMTCHYPCAFREDQDKRRCSAIDGKTGYCRECPNKCSWSVHFSQTYRWVYDLETREGNIESLREKYNATSLTTLEFIEMLDNEVKAITKEILRLIAKAVECIQRLEQMALHFSPRAASLYISKMIDSERQQKLPGFEDRIANLQNLLDFAESSEKRHGNEPLLPQQISD